MTFITYILHAVWVYLFMYVLNWKMFGLGLGRSVTEFLNAFILIVIVRYKGLFPKINFKWGKEAFTNWGNYLKLSIPMGSILYFDWIAADI